jgi:hypothetical protein
MSAIDHSLMQLIVSLIIVGFLGWVIWSISRPRCTFVVKVRDGVPDVLRGAVSRAFVQEIAEVATRHGIRDCVVRGVAKGARIGLTFSNNVPAVCQQQLRNIWTLSSRR